MLLLGICCKWNLKCTGERGGWEIGETRKILEGWKKVSEQFKDANVHDPLNTSNSPNADADVQICFSSQLPEN